MNTTKTNESVCFCGHLAAAHGSPLGRCDVHVDGRLCGCKGFTAPAPAVVAPPTPSPVPPPGALFHQAALFEHIQNVFAAMLRDLSHTLAERNRAREQRDAFRVERDRAQAALANVHALARVPGLASYEEAFDLLEAICAVAAPEATKKGNE